MEEYHKRYTNLAVLSKNDAMVYKCVENATGLTKVSKIFSLRQWKEVNKIRAYREGCILMNVKGNMLFVQIEKWIKTDKYMFIIMEDCETDLHDLVLNYDVSLADKLRLFLQMAYAVKHLHDTGIAHRDLKLENFFVRKYRHVCLGDFGLSTFAMERTQPSSVGTPLYVAPEVLGKKRRYDPRSSDIYSLGICYYAIIFLCMPINETNTTKLWELKKFSISVPKIIIGGVSELIEKMLSVKPSERPNIEEVVCELKKNK